MSDDAGVEGNEAPAEPSSGSRKAAVVGLTAKARQRLEDALPGWEFTDDPATPGTSLTVLSSRADSDVAQGALAQFREHGDGPFVVVTHPGGEDATVDLLSAGAALAVPEGRENRIANLFADAALANDLVDAYVRWAGSSGGRQAALERDEAAGVPGPMAFDDALAEAGASGAPPRVVVVSARDLDLALRGLNHGIANLLRRRIAQGIQMAVRPVGAVVYALDETRFATLLPDDEGVLDRILEPLRASIESYSPVRGRSLRLGLGHAGIEDAPDGLVMRDLAERACDIAVETGRRVVSAADLVEAVADRTTLVTLLGAVEAVEARDPDLAGHAARVADLAVALGQALGMEDADLSRLGTAARFHDVGKLGLPAVAAGDVEGLEGADLETWRSHVERSAKAVTPSAGTLVATIVRHHHERFDGTGFPDGLAADAIPLASRIIAVADAFDIALTRSGGDVGLDEALRRVHDEAGTAWDRTIVDALVDLAQRRRLPHSLTG